MVLAGGYGCCHCYLATVERSMLISTAAVLYSFFRAEKSVIAAQRLWKWARSRKLPADRGTPPEDHDFNTTTSSTNLFYFHLPLVVVVTSEEMWKGAQRAYRDGRNRCAIAVSDCANRGKIASRP